MEKVKRKGYTLVELVGVMMIFGGLLFLLIVFLCLMKYLFS